MVGLDKTCVFIFSFGLIRVVYFDVPALFLRSFLFPFFFFFKDYKFIQALSQLFKTHLEVSGNTEYFGRTGKHWGLLINLAFWLVTSRGESKENKQLLNIKAH